MKTEQNQIQDWVKRALLGCLEPTQHPVPDFSTALPFSFKYGGRSSFNLLTKWKCITTKHPTEKDRHCYTVTYIDEETKLELIYEITIFDDFPAVEWVLRFQNKGKQDTPILEDIQALNLQITKPEGKEFILHHSLGCNQTVTDFLPVDQMLLPGKKTKLRSDGGRSADGYLPFFNLEWENKGLVMVMGWSGQWVASFQCDDKQGLRIQAGMETTHLKIHPDETIRTPRILLVFWEGNEQIRGHNLLRRLLLTHYSPHFNDKVVMSPVALNTWFTFSCGNDATEENQLEVISHLPPLGVEAFWLDAGWFEGGWPYGVGNWSPKQASFPTGLKSLGDAAHSLEMKFIVWFEPERVAAQSQIAREHPEWVLRVSEPDELQPEWMHKDDGVFNLGIPEAREWLTNLLSQYITDWGIDIYRQDCNIRPLKFWHNNDSPDRQGITEIHHIEGLYAMWDELLARHPGLIIDNCSSGCRRIDLETISRSIILWQSDYFFKPIGDQVQNAGLNLWVPIHCGGCQNFDPYSFRSIMSTGVSICSDSRRKDFPMEAAQKAIAELKSLRPFFLGDYYPLLEINADETCWYGSQFDRPDLNEGIVLLFQRAKSPYPTAEVKLHNLNPEADYELIFEDTGEKKIDTGKNLSCLSIEIASVPGSILLRYRAVSGGSKR